MRRPLADKRIIGPVAQFGEVTEDDRIADVNNGPIWTWVEVTTFQGSRAESPQANREHVQFVDNEVKNLVTSDEVKERLEFAGELNEFDIFTDKTSDLTVSSYIRHAEDMISIPLLHELVDPLQATINAHEDLTVRDYRVVTEEFVEGTMPEAV